MTRRLRAGKYWRSFRLWGTTSSNATVTSDVDPPAPTPQPGDLVFFRNPAHHVGIALGNGQMVDDAPHSGATVRVGRTVVSLTKLA